MIVEIFFDDDVDHSDNDSSVGARTNLQPVLCLGSKPRAGRIENDQLRAALLHNVDDPVAEEAVAVGDENVVANVEDVLGVHVLGVSIALLEVLRHVGYEEVAHEAVADGGTRQVARVTGQEAQYEVRAVKTCIGQVRGLPADVAAGALHGDDGLGAIVFPNLMYVLYDVIVSLVPSDALPLVLATLANALQRVLQAIGMIERLDDVEATHAQTALVVRGQRVAFDLLYLAILGVVQDGAAVVTARCGPHVRTRDCVLAFLPLPVGFVNVFVDAFEFIGKHT